jgi:hypothetical protein
VPLPGKAGNDGDLLGEGGELLAASGDVGKGELTIIAGGGKGGLVAALGEVGGLPDEGLAVRNKRPSSLGEAGGLPTNGCKLDAKLAGSNGALDGTIGDLEEVGKLPVDEGLVVCNKRLSSLGEVVGLE